MVYDIVLEEESKVNQKRFRKVVIFATFVASFFVVPSLTYWYNKKVVDDLIPSQCLLNQINPNFAPDKSRINERNVLFPHMAYMLHNATILDGDGERYDNMDILVSNGTITDIGTNLVRDGLKVYDINGKFVTPGLIDVHSHFGTRAQPQLILTEDTNEFTSPVTPFVRSVDGINPNDPELDSLVASGVTSHLVLTGSKNLLSGESYGIKLHRLPNNLVDEMLIQYNVATNLTNKLVRWFKIAYGENEKLTKLPGYPVSRMGESWVIRKLFERAKKLKDHQDEWCSNYKYQTTPYPQDLETNTLVDILRGDLNINVHLYETYDFETLLRVADEYNITIGSFHHALSSYKIIKLLKDHNASIAIFSDEYGGKKEQYEATVNAPKILADNNIPVAIKTDHPALPGQDLLYYAQIAHNFGLSSSLALASVTSVPAKIMSMDHRIGHIRKGYDADLVVWDSHPLTLGVKAEETIVDGIPYFKFSKLTHKSQQDYELKQRAELVHTCSSSFIIQGISTVLIDKLRTSQVNIEDNLKTDAVLLVRNNKLECIGSTEFCKTEDLGLQIIKLSNGYILPGVTTAGSSTGMTEMINEGSTSDGDGKSYKKTLYASNGLSLEGNMLERLKNSGINLAVSAPIGSHFFKGISTRFSLGTEDLDKSIVDEEVAVHFNLGHKAKSPEVPTISAQIQELRSFLESDKHSSLPVAVHTHNKAIIAHVIRLKKDFKNRKIVIMGGQEAYLLADELAESKIPVILSPWRCTEKLWDNRRCSPNPPLMEKYSIEILHDAGVEFALGQDVDNSARRTLWEAGLAFKAIPGFSLQEAVNLVSYNINDIFGIETVDDYVIFENNPLTFGATLAFSFSNRTLHSCFPHYEEEHIGKQLNYAF